MPFEVIDTIRNLTDADIVLLKANGIVGVSRYIARSSGIGKIMGRAECDRIVASGLALIVNYEQSAGDWQGGAARGASDGAWARNYVRNTLGLPDSVCIIQSIDTGVSSGQMPTAAAYQQAFNDAGGVGPQGCYGPGTVITYLAARGLIRVGWQWNDVAGSPSVPAANIRQYRNKPYNLPFTYDVNTPITAYYGQYTGTGMIEGDGDLTDAQDKILNAILQKVLTLPADTWAETLEHGSAPASSEVYVTEARELANQAWLQGQENANAIATLSAKVDNLAVGGIDLAVLRQIIREEVLAAQAELRLQAVTPS